MKVLIILLSLSLYICTISTLTPNLIDEDDSILVKNPSSLFWGCLICQGVLTVDSAIELIKINTTMTIDYLAKYESNKEPKLIQTTMRMLKEKPTIITRKEIIKDCMAKFFENNGYITRSSEENNNNFISLQDEQDLQTEINDLQNECSDELSNKMNESIEEWEKLIYQKYNDDSKRNDCFPQNITENGQNTLLAICEKVKAQNTDI